MPEIEELVAMAQNFMRAQSAQSEDASQRHQQFHFEAAETAAWDSYALCWAQFAMTDTNEEDTADAAAKFANRMLEHRRKTFGVELLGTASPKPSP